MIRRLNKHIKEDLDFEIAFYEDLIKDKHDFIEALILLGDVYTKRGFYKKGLNVDKRLTELRPDDPVAYYNLACSYSLLGKINLSLSALKDAFYRGYHDIKYMLKDSDLKNIRKDKRFRCLINKWKKYLGGDKYGIWFLEEEEVKEGSAEKEKACQKSGKKAKEAAEKGSKGS